MDDPTSQDRFFNRLEAFDEFNDFVDFGAYRPLPDDWTVMLSDVVGSTSAIADGRYKQVNMVGAASITAVLNVCGDIDVPYVFGGDGGTLVVPNSLRDVAADALVRLQSASEEMFGLDLRVAAVPVRDLRARGADVSVRKYRMSEGNYLAMFAGGGLELADRLMKDPIEQDSYLLPPIGGREDPDLDGLSCRWEPLQSTNGEMLTLMVKGTAGDAAEQGATLNRFLEAVSRILGHGLRESSPASDGSMKFRWPPSGLRMEARATAGDRGYCKSYAWVLFSSLVQLWCERFGRKAGGYDAPKYRGELQTNTDFRKYDGVLRAVLDVRADEASAIETYLEKEYGEGRLIYGIHRADAALMTCLVFDLEQGEHVHFIDGSGGGFALAATGFKKRFADLVQRTAAAPQ